ncbi:nuclear pore complex protein Nup54 [Chloropicon primus]|uniref:Nuclear pore complex protein Nup54 n=1 Tax=Chloropicon primus TaxID=1764295 RepID=A0A5B8MP88_9CHLO|nr:nuclear pore complex protein Nup54 [Chloropicon primus]UPR01535.1 nuclear pore complex protein Nup54 [Chloropicon primus]|eukprot:QDZ22319.1 nuclear pore complex protein Nup54 [Chloropicon primus]
MGGAQPAAATPGALTGFPPFPSDTGHLASSQVANDLQALDAAFNPKAANNSYRFRHLFTNVVNSEQSVSLAAKPPNVDGVQWQEAIDEVESLESLTAGSRPANEKLWPVGVGYGDSSGFQELIARAQSQEAEIMKHKEFLERVQGTIASITRKHEVDIQKAVQNCRAKYEEQTHKLIHIMRFVDFLEHRAFRHPFTSQEDELAKKFEKLQNAFDESGSTQGGPATQVYQSYVKPSQGQQKSDLKQLPKRIEALAALARELKAHKKANGQVQLGSGSDKLVSGFSPENCEKICNTLSKYLEAVNKVQTNLQRDLVHMDIVEKHSKDSDSGKQYSVLY